MLSPVSSSLIEHLKVIPDPRSRCLHPLKEILTIAILSVISGADSWEENSNEITAIPILHWVMDVAFREDESRVRIGYAAENFSRLRQMALNLLKQEKTAKVGVKIKRNKAGWDLNYLLKVLGVTGV
jgi:hypothetical protein